MWAWEPGKKVRVPFSWMIKAYLYLYLRVSADTDDLNFDRSTQAMCRKKIKLTFERKIENEINFNYIQGAWTRRRFASSTIFTKIEAVIGPRMRSQNMILFSFVVQQSRFSNKARITTHDETNINGKPVHQTQRTDNPTKMAKFALSRPHALSMLGHNFHS